MSCHDYIGGAVGSRLFLETEVRSSNRKSDRGKYAYERVLLWWESFGKKLYRTLLCSCTGGGLGKNSVLEYYQNMMVKNMVKHC